MTQGNASPEIGAKIVADGIETNFHEAGTGFPLLLIHGSGPGVSAWANWRLNIPEFSRFAHVLAPDIVGFGYTSLPVGFQFDLSAWVNHLVAFMDAKKVDVVDIVGNSFGGALALRLASLHPGRVRNLVLMGSAGLSFPMTEGLDAVWGYTPSVQNMHHLLRVFVHDQRFATPELAQLRYEASVRAGVQESFGRMFSPPPRQRYLDALAADEQTLRKLPHRCLVVHGREDKVIPLASSIQLSGLLRDARLHVFPNCGHWTQIEVRDAFNRLVQQFLGSND